MSDDLPARRNTNGTWALAQLLEVGGKDQVEMPAMKKVAELLGKAVKSGDGVPSISPAQLLASIDAPFESTRNLIFNVSCIFSAVFGVIILVALINELIPRAGL